MSSEAVQIWRTRPVEGQRAASSEQDIDRRYIFPSARQALDAVVSTSGLDRRSYVGIPDFASHCVADFLSRHATTVPLRFLPAEEAGAVLVYDQWGWQRPVARLREVADRFGTAAIIWDRVDSLPDDFEVTAREEGIDRTFQVFSLSKTLGVGGGGLLWRDRIGWVEPALAGRESFGRALQAWVDTSPDAGGSERTHIELFLRKEIAAWPPKLRVWLDDHSISVAAHAEAAARRERLRAGLDMLKPELPDWMRAGIGSKRPAPGILPVPLSSGDSSLLDSIRQTADLDLCFYHFDFSESYLRPDWVRVLPVPLHSQVSLDQLARIADVLTSRQALAR
jgi:hypothetical protein